MRTSVAFLTWLMAFCAMGQVGWEYLEHVEWHNSWARDMLEVNGQFILVSTSMQDPTSKLLIHMLDEDGSLNQTRTIFTGSDDPDVCGITAGDSGQHLDLWGSSGYFGGSPAFFNYRLSAALELQDSLIHPLSLATGFWRSDNTIRLSDGKMLFMGYGSLGPTWYSSLLLSDGSAEPVVHRLFSSELPQWIMAQHGIPVDGVAMVALQGGTPEPPGVKRSEYLYLDEELEITSSFVGPNVYTGGISTWADSVIMDQPYVHALPSGNLIISGKMGTLAGSWNVLIKTTREGELLSTYFPPRPYVHCVTPRLQAMDVDQDGDLLFCQMENLEPYNLFAPTQPSAIRVIKLDTSLTVVCENLIDGFLDNRYYLPTRIKATEDGGYAVLGATYEVGSSLGTALWVAKFPSSTCTAGIDGLAPEAHALVYPNPGNDELHVLLDFPAHGVLELRDITGRIWCSVPLINGKARVHTSALTPGVYFYRSIDSSGRSLAKGKWVKQ